MLKSTGKDIYIDNASRRWEFKTNPNTLTIVNSVYGVSGDEDNHFSFAVNGFIKAASACIGHSIVFVILDPITLKPLYNQPVPSTIQSGTSVVLWVAVLIVVLPASSILNFLHGHDWQKENERFSDWVPSGYFVAMRLNIDAPFDQNPFVDVWKNDESVYGAGNSLYSRLKNAGFTELDNYTSPRIWSFIYRKNNASFQPTSKMSTALERITLGQR
jgi:hypothetical protein